MNTHTNDTEQTDESTAPVPKGYMQDSRGALVPIARVKDLDKERDRVVRRLVAAAQDMSAQIARFKLLAMSELEQFVDLSAAQYNVELRGAKGKGNVTLTSYCGRWKVERQISEHIVFDERLQVAKALIDERLHTWSRGANANIKALVAHAFQVDKAGNVSTGRVLSLRGLKIDDAEWMQAMDAIADAMRTTGSTSYIRFYERDAHGKYQAVALNIAAL